jgi:hypothetical protein
MSAIRIEGRKEAEDRRSLTITVEGPKAEVMLAAILLAASYNMTPTAVMIKGDLPLIGEHFESGATSVHVHQIREALVARLHPTAIERVTVSPTDLALESEGFARTL